MKFFQPYDFFKAYERFFEYSRITGIRRLKHRTHQLIYCDVTASLSTLMLETYQPFNEDLSGIHVLERDGKKTMNTIQHVRISECFLGGERALIFFGKRSSLPLLGNVLLWQVGIVPSRVASSVPFLVDRSQNRRNKPQLSGVLAVWELLHCGYKEYSRPCHMLLWKYYVSSFRSFEVR